MGGSHDIGARGVNLGVNCESRSIHRVLPFHDLTLVIYQNQVRDTNLAEVHAKRIYPKVIAAFRITGGDMAGDSFIESES